VSASPGLQKGRERQVVTTSSPSLNDYILKPRRRWPVALLAFGLGAGAAGGAVALRDNPGGSDAVVKKAVTSTAKVETRDLRTFLSYTGNLSVKDSLTISAGSSGTLTEVVPIGTKLTTGMVLARIDAVPVTVIEGAVPIWRDLTSSSTAGADIGVIEKYLVDNGFDPSNKVVVDEQWTSATTAAVKRWQTALGETTTGTVRKAAFVMVPSGASVTSTPTVGEAVRSGAALATVQTLTTPTVALAIKVGEIARFHVDDVVDLVLADSTTTTGTVTNVGSVASAATGPNSDPSVAITIAAKVDAATAIEGPVTVKLVDKSALGALTVPARALVALAEGGEAVEVKAADGTIKLVGVKPGMYVDGYVEVTGQLKVGDSVVVPA
jgi:peptidoglycan hydrolase-like protein with peptidoglycan-binding domain